MTTIRSARPDDTQRLVALAAATGLFTPNEADLLLRQTLDDLHAGRLGDRHLADVLVDDDGSTGGWAYYALNERSNAVWDLFWIGVAPPAHGRGLGTQLLTHVERRVAEAGGRLLVIETSDQPLLARTREFYRARGYSECGRVPHFYADGDGKVIFARHFDTR